MRKFLKAEKEKQMNSNNKNGKFTFIDLFAGIGGFHIAMHHIGGKCVFASEIDKYARITYEHNFKKASPEIFLNGNFNTDINNIKLKDIPDFDILCAGFPCQPFSHAGLKKGFEDTRGTLFFNIVEIINFKRKSKNPPQVILLENVKGLKTHDQGNTLSKIVETLERLNYYVKYEVLSAKNFGLPQNRQRIFIVAWLKTASAPKDFKFPLGIDNNNKALFNRATFLEKIKTTKVADILLDEVPDKLTISDRMYEGHLRRVEKHRAKGNGFGFSVFSGNRQYTNTISARYWKDGSEILIEQEGKNPRMLDPIEAGLLQGYPMKKGFEIPQAVTKKQAYKQFGNSVSIPVVKALAKEIVKQLI